MFDTVLILSDSLLRLLTFEERAAVIAFEIARIKNGDALALGITGFVTSLWLKVARALDRMVTLGFYKKPHFFHISSAFLLRTVNQLIVSKNSFSLADKEASIWLGSPKQLAVVIWKLNSFAKTSDENMPIGCSHLFIVNPLAQSRKLEDRLFQIHPPIDKRIQNLVGYYPL
jgi:Zn-dependent protease with chaperone function